MGLDRFWAELASESLRPSGFAPAFGRAVRPLRGLPGRWAEAQLYLEATATATAKTNAGVLRCAQNDKQFLVTPQMLRMTPGFQ